MNVSYRWLRALAPGLELDPAALADRLAELGFPVEGAVDLSEGLDDIVVARVRRVREHPAADRLLLCDVEAGGKVLQVVCGAPNVVAGGWYPFAPVGATLPGGMKIGKAKLRGETSHGMLCSERELGLGRDAGGIMALEGDFSPGRPLVEALGLDDVRLDVEVTSNRPDLLSHRGIAREVAPGGCRGVSLPGFPGEDPGVAAAIEALETAHEENAVSAASGGTRVGVEIEAPDLCGAYLGLVVSGVKVGPSPGWLQTRLRAAGSRPINNVVDATNYVLLELGQPLHAFDLDRLADRRIVVRRAKDGEGIRTLDGEDRTLTDQMLAICDAERPVAVAGVMGGEDSEVGRETTDILLECALFTPGPVRDTRKALGLSTDASYRFERGVDPEGLRDAILRTARLVAAVAGGTVSGPLLEVRPRPFARNTVDLRPARVEKLLGIPFSRERLVGLLEPLGFEPSAVTKEAADAVRFHVPGFRSWDASREVDLIEEVARRYGYDRFPEEGGPFRPGTVPDDPLFLLEDRVRETLARRGLLEAHTLAFAPAGQGEVQLLNPVSAEERFLRTDLLPGLLRRLEFNLARGNRDVRLFEVGTVFHGGPDGELPREDTRVACVLHGRRHPPHWSDGAEAFDLWDVRGLAEDVARAVGGEGWRVRPDGKEYLVVDARGEVMGRAGGVNDGSHDPPPWAELDLPPWAEAVWGLEVTLPATPEPLPDPGFRPLPQHPAVERDLALLVPRELPAGTVLERIRSEGGPHLEAVETFDLYEGREIPENTRSIAVRLRFRSPERTLRDAEVDERMTHVTRTLEEELGIGIRGRSG